MTPLFKKLNLKDQKAIYVINSPSSFNKSIKEVEKSVGIKAYGTLSETKEMAFFLGFVSKQKEVDELATKVAAKLVADGIFWLAYPKSSSKKYVCEFNRDTGWKVLGQLGFEPVRQIAIDEDWTALRFRKAENIKKMTRNFAMTKVGKEKVKASTKG